MLLAGSSENADMQFVVISEKQWLQPFGQMYPGEEGEVIDWLLMDYLSEIILPCLPVLPLFPLFQSPPLPISLSLMLLNVSPSVPSPWVQVALPELHYIKAKHAALMTTCITLPWCHRSSAPLKSERLGTLTTRQPPTFQLCVHQLENTVFSRLPKQSIFPSDTRVV